MKATVYFVSVHDRHGDRLVKATLDKEEAASWCQRFNTIEDNPAYAWHVGMKVYVPPRSKCQPAWHNPKRKRKAAVA